jgi:hypothetical protein
LLAARNIEIVDGKGERSKIVGVLLIEREMFWIFLEVTDETPHRMMTRGVTQVTSP